jgi:hypothetical protein
LEAESRYLQTTEISVDLGLASLQSCEKVFFFLYKLLSQNEPRHQKKFKKLKLTNIKYYNLKTAL